MSQVRSFRVVTIGSLAVVIAALLSPSIGHATTREQGAELVLVSGSGAPGIPVSLRGRIPTDHRVPVELQRLDDGGFVTLSVARTDRRGWFSFTTNVPEDRSTASYRVTSQDVVTPTRSVVTGMTTRLTQDPDLTKLPETQVGSNDAVISDDGTFVAFASAGNIFVWDRSRSTTTRISATSEHGNGYPSISNDGRYVAYVKDMAYYPVPRDRVSDVVVWDRTTRSTTRVTKGNKGSSPPSISGDGRFIVFWSFASNLVRDDTNKHADVFVWERSSRSTRRITDGDDDSYSEDEAISNSGGYVTFSSAASDLVPGDRNGESDIFVWNGRTGQARRVTGGGGSAGSQVISGNGRFIAYTSKSNLVSDTTHPLDVFVWDRAKRRTIRLTAGTSNSIDPSISNDGRHLVYASHSTTLVPGDPNDNWADVIAWDRKTRTTTRLNSGSLNARVPMISGDGRHVVYEYGELDGINGPYDVYLWDTTS